MSGSVLKVESLPPNAVDAAASFYRDCPAEIEARIAAGAAAIIICLPSAPRDHDDWRRGAARDLARQHAPSRINIVGGGGPVEIEAILSYIENAPGITGQYLAAHE